MKKKLIYLFIIAIALVSYSCKDGGFKNSSSGFAYEVFVVIDEDLWEKPAGRALYNVLDTDIPGLPEPERSFRIMHAAPMYFKGALKLIRNIIYVDINPERYTQAKFNTANDVYAQPQVVVTIQAPNEEEFESFVNENSQYIIDFFTRVEMNRQILHLEKKHNNNVSNKLADMFDIDIWVPGDLASSKTGENFFWASTNGAMVDQSLVVYSYPYTDEDTFTKEYFINKRDSVMKANIPGGPEGSYMSTDDRTVQVKNITVQGKYAFEARGLWKMVGDFMGGPFVSHSRVDEINNRVITAEIFIFAPDNTKRNFVRTMEASLFTMKLPEDRNPAVVITPDADE